MEIVDVEEARVLFDQEHMRQEMLDRLTVVFCAINEKIRAKNVTYHWSDRRFDVTVRAVNLTQDDLEFICKEYEETGRFPCVTGASNSVLCTAAFTFWLDESGVKATDDGTEANRTIV